MVLLGIGDGFVFTMVKAVYASFLEKRKESSLWLWPTLSFHNFRMEHCEILECTSIEIKGMGMKEDSQGVKIFFILFSLSLAHVKKGEVRKGL